MEFPEAETRPNRTGVDGALLREQWWRRRRQRPSRGPPRMGSGAPRGETHLAPPPPSTKAMALPVSTRAKREKSECRSGGLWQTRSYSST